MILIKLIICVLPWKLKRFCLTKIFNFEIDKTAKIGFSWIYPTKLIMKEYTSINHLSVAIHLDTIEIEEYSSIGRGNWITGFSTISKSKHFAHQSSERNAYLKIGRHSAITKNHHLDCTSQITIGDFSTLAGYNTQLITHSINIIKGIQDSNPIIIGDYCFIGTNCTILGGAILPSYSVLGAKSLLNKKYFKTYTLYGGVPAISIKSIPNNAKYFNREIGFVN